MVYTTRARTYQNWIPPPNTIHVNQVTQDNHAAQLLSRAWPITRANRASRGILRNGNACFWLTGLQELLHLPGFMNWVNTHHVVGPGGTIQNPCVPQNNFLDYPDKLCLVCNTSSRYDITHCTVCTQKFPDFQCYTCMGYSDSTLLACQHCTDVIKDLRPSPICLACAMKTLIAEYWGAVDLDGTGAPIPFNQPLALAPGSSRAVDPFKAFVRARYAPGSQEDSHDFVNAVLEQIYRSSQHLQYTTVPIISDWNRAFIASFEMKYDHVRTCHDPACGFRGTTALTSNVINLSPLPTGQNDSLREAISRYFDAQVVAGICPGCNIDTIHDQEMRITAGPEQLIIGLNIGYNNPATGVMTRIRNHIGLPLELDLTPYQAGTSTNLKYKLSAISRHQGINGAGHWIASVKGPEKARNAYMINDGQTRRQPPRSRLFFSKNPQEWPWTNQAGFPSDANGFFASSCIVYTRDRTVHRPL